MRTMLLALGAALAIATGVAGCGGTGAGAGGAQVSAANQAVTAQDLKVSLVASSPTLASDGLTPVDLTAIVTDAGTGVAVPGKQVSFAANDPKSAVRIEITQATTDASGVATARLFLNGDASERDVRVLASVDQKTPSELTVRVAANTGGGTTTNNSRGELTVRLGTDNLIEDLRDQLSYRKRYVAIVTDNAGIPRANASVLATLRSKRYFVGYWHPVGNAGWSPVYLNPNGTPSEDTANFGRCDAGEDANNDKVLTPGNPAAYTVQSQTDANGLAVLNIVYPKSFAEWVVMELEVTASVGGTEGYNAILIPLPTLAADVTNLQVAPPSIIRTRESLSTTTEIYPIGSGEEATVGSPYGLFDSVAGSPFPYQSATPTCP